MTTRNERLWELMDFSKGKGLEIGPLAAAIVTRDRADVSYVDVFDRDGIVDHYRHDPSVDVDQIPEIDYPLWNGERMQTLAEAARPGAPFDWAVASHVIEHVPDVIGWLRQMAEITADDGALVLVVPDRRYCFDAHRPPTTVGQMLQAYDAGDTIPSVRAVYDYFSSVVTGTAHEFWRGFQPTYDNRIHGMSKAMEKVAETRKGEYIDAHVWLFTPDSLAETIDELRQLGLCDWRVEVLEPTRKGDLEFLAVLRRESSDVEAESVVSSRSYPAWRDESEELRAEVRRLKNRVRVLKGRVQAMEESRRWRVGGAITAPARAFRKKPRR